MGVPLVANSSGRWSAGVSHAARSALGLALLLSIPGNAQYNSTKQHVPPASDSTRMGGMNTSPFSDIDPIEAQVRLRALNTLRQKSLVSDTDKLLKLTIELNAEITAAHPDSLTANQLRKLGEIEKLAHSVKEKMGTSVGGVAWSPGNSPEYR